MEQLVILLNDPSSSGKSTLAKALRESLEAGSGVIIDHVITSGRIFDQLTESLSSYPMRSVLITCPLDILRERERVRGDRCVGSAEASAEYFFQRKDMTWSSIPTRSPRQRMRS